MLDYNAILDISFFTEDWMTFEREEVCGGLAFNSHEYRSCGQTEAGFNTKACVEYDQVDDDVGRREWRGDAKWNGESVLAL